MKIKKKCVAMLLAGGQGSRLYALTQKVAKPAIPYGGKNRFCLLSTSNEKDNPWTTQRFCGIMVASQ